MKIEKVIELGRLKLFLKETNGIVDQKYFLEIFEPFYTVSGDTELEMVSYLISQLKKDVEILEKYKETL